jgi:hypothetical protein
MTAPSSDMRDLCPICSSELEQTQEGPLPN